MAALNEDVEAVVLEGCGHPVNLDDPEAFNAALLHASSPPDGHPPDLAGFASRRTWVTLCPMTRFGYTLMTEQSGPKDLVRYAAAAEDAGFDLLVSKATTASPTSRWSRSATSSRTGSWPKRRNPCWPGCRRPRRPGDRARA